VQRALVEMAQSGDEEAFGALVRAAGDRLMAIAFRILRDAGLAEDVVQQTLVIAWRELPALRDLDRFDAWLHRTLVNACYAESRRARRWSANVRLLPMEGPGGRDEMADIAHRDELERGFRRLPVDQRTVFVFHHYLGMDHQEIADELAIPVGTVKSRLHYAMHAMRAALEADARPAPGPERKERRA